MDFLGQIEHDLGRDLREDERQVFRFLSAQGMAKMNSDVGKGAGLEATLADLGEVFRLAQKRKVALQAALPYSAGLVLRRLNRSPTADEMLLLSEVPVEAVLSLLSEELMKGVQLEDALEDMAQAHLQRKLHRDAQQVANAVDACVSVS
eukprot:RCo046064